MHVENDKNNLAEHKNKEQETSFVFQKGSTLLNSSSKSTVVVKRPIMKTKESIFFFLFFLP